MSRKALPKTGRVETIPVDANFAGNEVAWLVGQTQKYNLRWLLAHADDGVIWGEARNGGLALSVDAFREKISPLLRAQTLQQARLFSEQGELLLWRTTEGFAARLLTDKDSDAPQCLEERYLLWGNRLEDEKDGFFLLTEGKQGLRHAPPLKPKLKGEKQEAERMSLTIRHYLAYDDEGQAYIKMSRLVKLNNGGQDE